MKNKNILIALFLAMVFFIFVLFSATRIYAGNPWPPDDVRVSADPVILGAASQIEVVVMAYPLAYAWKITVDFGDGLEEMGFCFIDDIIGTCVKSFSHPYSAAGKYAVKVKVCDHLDDTICEIGMTYARVDLPHCGNGILELDKGEECDDGDTVSGDGCSQDCKIEHPRPSLPTNDDLNPLEANTFGELFRDIVGALFWVAVVLGPLLIIAGGFMIIFAGLDPGKIVLGKKIILYTAVILGIILIIKAMTAFFAPDITF